eukprot:jgi/Hompol1/2657/HPOL_005482-RA
MSLASIAASAASAASAAVGAAASQRPTHFLSLRLNAAHFQPFIDHVHQNYPTFVPLLEGGVKACCVNVYLSLSVNQQETDEDRWER